MNGLKRLKLCKNWIGKSVGCEINFKIFDKEDHLKIYTTRPDTIFGASFVALSINHSFVSGVLEEQKLKKIIKEFEESGDKEKIGYQLPLYAINPVTKEKLPIYVANFVLDTYGQGAIFGCPAHDERDYEFAKKYSFLLSKCLNVKTQSCLIPRTG